MLAQVEQIPAYWFLITSHVLRKKLKHRKWFLGNFKSVVEWERTTNAIQLHEPFPSAIDELGEDLFENKEAGKGNREKVSRDFRHKGIMTLCWLFTIFSRLILHWWQWRGNKNIPTIELLFRKWTPGLHAQIVYLFDVPFSNDLVVNIQFGWELVKKEIEFETNLSSICWSTDYWTS